MTESLMHALIGGFIGVLINYLADVLPRTRKLSKPVCQHCGKTFSLRGYLFSLKCPECKSNPPARNWVVLICSIIAAVLMGIYPPAGLSFWAAIPALIFLGMIMVIDIEHHVVLIETSIAGLVLFLIYGWLMQGILVTAIGGIAGFVIMIVIYYFGIFFSKGLGKIRKEDKTEEGMGFGDVYAGAFLGLFTGWPFVIGMIIMAIVVSGLFSFVYLLVKSIRKDYKMFSTIPYTPFLILGAIATFYIQF